MAHGQLPFEYESEENSTGLTSFAGLPLFLELMFVMGFAASIRKHLNARPSQGWTDTQQIVAMICLHLAGGDCLDDLEMLESDEGFCKILEEVEGHGLRQRERRAIDARWRVEKTRSIPSPDAAGRYLEAFHAPEESTLVQAGTAFVPQPNEHLRGLSELLAETCAFAQLKNPQTRATLDQDATLIETHKAGALFCYKHHKAYQPLNVFWSEQGLMVYSEFRDGNCPAAWRNLDVMKHALANLPSGVNEVEVRTDTAGYEVELLQYLAEGKDPRFGVIDFAIGVDVTAAFRKAVSEVCEKDWRPLDIVDEDGRRWKTNQEYAEVCFVPTWAGHSKNGPEYRFLATREAIDNPLPGMEQEQAKLPFPTWSSKEGQRYKIYGVVTNKTVAVMAGDDLIRWHRKRCGYSEHVHGVLKTDLGAGQLPSGKFGANAAWWLIAILACNLHVLMQRLVFDRKGLGQRLKAVRFSWLGVAGRVISHARRLIIRLPRNHPAFEIIQNARQILQQMSTGPPPLWLAPR